MSKPNIILAGIAVIVVAILILKLDFVDQGEQGNGMMEQEYIILNSPPGLGVKTSNSSRKAMLEIRADVPKFSDFQVVRLKEVKKISNEEIDSLCSKFGFSSCKQQESDQYTNVVEVKTDTKSLEIAPGLVIVDFNTTYYQEGRNHFRKAGAVLPTRQEAINLTKNFLDTMELSLGEYRFESYRAPYIADGVNISMRLIITPLLNGKPLVEGGVGISFGDKKRIIGFSSRVKEYKVLNDTLDFIEYDRAITKLKAGMYVGPLDPTSSRVIVKAVEPIYRVLGNPYNNVPYRVVTSWRFVTEAYGKTGRPLGTAELFLPVEKEDTGWFSEPSKLSVPEGPEKNSE